MKLQSINRYETYKDSGVEWLGEVPTTWALNRHKDNFIFVSDRCVNPSLEKVGLENIEGKTGRFITTNSEFDGDGVEFKKNDILFGKLRPYLAKVYLAEFNGNAVGDIFVYRPKQSTTSHFAQYLMLSDRYIDVINSSTAGAKMPRVSSNFIANLPVSTPPIAEQTAIATYLDTKTAQIDRKIDLLSQKATQYGKLKQSLINETVTRGLDKTVPMKDSGVEWIGEVPAHWEVNRIKEVCDINKSTLSEKTPASYEFDYVDIGSVTYGVKGYIKERMTFDMSPSRAKRIVQKGDTIISTVRTYLKAIASIDEEVSDLIVSTGFAVISPRKEIADKYCSYLLMSNCIVDEICALSTGVSYPATNATVIGDLFFLIPPIAEQQAIAAFLDDKTSYIDRIIATINTQIDKLKELRKTLINDVVTGKIKVCETIE